MKVKAAVYIIAGLVLLCAFAFLRGCKLTDKLSILEGQHEILTETADALAKSHTALEAESKKIIAAKDAIIADRDVIIAAKRGQVTAGNKKLADLEAEFATLGTDNVAKVTNLVTQVSILKSNLTIAHSIIADKDAIIAAWDAKFTAQVKLTDSWKARFENSDRLHQLSRQELGVMAGQLRWAKIKGTLGTGLFIAGGAAVVYSLLKGKK